MAVRLTARQRRERVALINRLYEAHPERGYLAAITDGGAAYRRVLDPGQRAGTAAQARAARRVLKEIRRAARRAVLESGALTAAQVPLPPSAPAGRKADRGTPGGSTDLTQVGDEELAVRFDLVAGAANGLDSPFWGDARG